MVLNSIRIYMAKIRAFPKEILPIGQIEDLIAQWREAKEHKDWELADRLRSELTDTGILVEEIYFPEVKNARRRPMGPSPQ
jgi:cysteinyl-tRNA synthetase